MSVRYEDRGAGEVRVEEGEGRLGTVDKSRGRNWQLLIDADHLREPVTGWLDSTNGELAQWAVEGARVSYRICVHRKRNVDPGPGIRDVAPREKVREVEWLAPEGSDRPSPPPAQATQPGGIHEGWEYVAAVGCCDLAYEELVKLDVEPTAGRVKLLGRLVLEAADEAQRAVVGRVDRRAQSHTRARGAVRTVLPQHPPPIGGTEEDRLAWAYALADTAANLLAAAHDLITEEAKP